MKFKVGNIIKVIEKGYTYSRYDLIFKLLNFKNTYENEWDNYYKKEREQFRIEALTIHPSQTMDDGSKIILYKIVGLKTNKEILIDQRGIMLIEPYNFKLKVI